MRSRSNAVVSHLDYPRLAIDAQWSLVGRISRCALGDYKVYEPVTIAVPRKAAEAISKNVVVAGQLVTGDIVVD